jgi:hypothetical protein
MNSRKLDSRGYLAAASYFDHRAKRARHEGERERFLCAAARCRALAKDASESREAQPALPVRFSAL